MKGWKFIAGHSLLKKVRHKFVAEILKANVLQFMGLNLI
jgi:hypothetical protein